MKTELVGVKGKLQTKPFQLKVGQTLLVGRGENVDLQVLDASVTGVKAAWRQDADHQHCI